MGTVCGCVLQDMMPGICAISCQGTKQHRFIASSLLFLEVASAAAFNLELKSLFD